MAATINFQENGLHFKLPVYLIQGEEDILTPKELTKLYFDKIKAPAKKYFCCREPLMDTTNLLLICNIKL